MNNFNLIAPIYDQMGKLVFGKSLLASQVHFLSNIKESDSVLILGGGTGKLLEGLPKCRNVDYIDLSVKMINQAKKREGKSTVNFILADFSDHVFESTYDFIICPFFLDCFEERNLSKTIDKCHVLLNERGFLMVSDFDRDQTNPIILKSMLLFFKMIARLESNTLLNIRKMISDSGFEQIQIKNFKKGIFTAIYKKVS